MVALPTFVPISEAAHKYGLEEDSLRSLIQAGKIRAGVIMGEVVVSEEEVRSEAIETNGLRKEDLPEYKKHAHLKGRTIGLGEASIRYSIPITTLSGWVKKGIIRKVGNDGQKYKLDEQDVAYCELIYRRYGKKGRILFNHDGTPYKPKTNLLIS